MNVNASISTYNCIMNVNEISKADVAIAICTVEDTKIVSLSDEMSVNYITNTLLENQADYPFGSNIRKNFAFVQVIADEFMEMWKVKKPENVNRINFLCRGSSGAMMSALLVVELQKLGLNEEQVIISHIKKAGEDSHNSSIYIHRNDFTVIVDDFISSGNTIRAIYETSRKYVTDRIDCLCITGTFYKDDFQFSPRNVICGEVR